MQSLRRNIRRSKFVKQYLLTAIVFFLVLFSSKINAQSFRIQLHFIDSFSKKARPEIQIPQNKVTKNELNSFLSQLIVKLQKHGFLEASIDSVFLDENDWQIFLFAGNVFQWAQLSFASMPKDILLQSGIIPKLYISKKIESADVVFISEKILNAAENSGYPFAQVHFKVDSIINEQTIKGRFDLTLGSLSKIDTVIVHGCVNVSKNYLLPFLSLKQQSIYDQQIFSRISAKIRSNSFLKEKKPWNVEFAKEQTSLHLYLEEKKASQLNGIIGLLPNANANNKMQLTVDALLLLQNSFGHGEQFDLTYQNLQPQSPKLSFSFIYPFIFHSPLGVDIQFDLFKKDTTWQRTNFQLGIRYQFHGNDFVRMFVHQQSNRQIFVDTNWIITNKKLPANIDAIAKGFGAEICLNRTNHYFNPSQGWEFQFSCNQLTRDISRNSAIENLSSSSFNYSTLYDSSSLNRNQLFLKMYAAFFFKVMKNYVVKAALSSGFIECKNLFQNELYQIGGYKLMRGFNEQSIFAKEYHVISTEFRFPFDEKSFCYLFDDNGYITSTPLLKSYEGWYHGYGIGGVFQVKNGMFHLSYAVGSSPQSSIQFQNSKIHFGFISLF